MYDQPSGRVALLYPGDREPRRNPRPEQGRFSALFSALATSGLEVEPAVAHDDFLDEVREQLLRVDAVLVWFNPLEGGRDRTYLDAMLREVAATGVLVSAHPDIILKLGTKDVLWRTRELPWGCDTHLYRTLEQLGLELPVRLAAGGARVLKQYRGNGGDGVFKVERASADGSPIGPETRLRVRHAKRGSTEEEISLQELLARFEPYFAGAGRMIDQEFQPRITEGMIRCYLVHNRVAGFGLQAVNALFPAPEGAPASAAPAPGPRLYHPPTKPELQDLKRKLEQEWVPAAQELLEIPTDELPILWDCDFLLGPKKSNGEDSYVLCEINVSSVAPYPESAVPFMVEATWAGVRARRPPTAATTSRRRRP